MKRNVLLLTIDAFGADKFWNFRHSCTPFLDKLSTMGAILINAVSTTSSTTPSLASIHTGMYPFEHGIESTYGYRLKDSIETLAEILKKNGYSTFANVGGPLNSTTGLNRGFDYFAYRPAHLMLPIFRWKFAVKVARFNSFLLTREASKIFRRTQPWFYWIHLLDLHNRWRPRRWFRNESLSDYESALVNLDGKIMKLFNQIDLKRTLIIITADHGHHVSSLDPDRDGIDYVEAHGFHVYDTLVHIPLIIVCQELIPEESKINEQISMVDLVPSVLDILGYKKKAGFSGQSFASLIPTLGRQREESFVERPIYIEACGSILKRAGLSFLMGIRTPEWKLIVPKDKNSKRKPELFNLKSDPDELVNVFDKHPSITQQFMNELKNIIE